MNILIFFLLNLFFPKQQEITYITWLPEITITELSCETENNLNLLCGLVTAEADGEPQEGKELVVDVVLNRVKSKYYPNSIDSVIIQHRQFAKFHSKRFFSREETLKLVRKRYFNDVRTNFIGFLNPISSTHLKHVKWALKRPGRYVKRHWFHI